MKPVKIKRKTIDHMRRRAMWSARLVIAGRKMMGDRTGSADSFKSEVSLAAKKVIQWYGRRGQSVLVALQRRCMS